jgi:hypothetical protein
MDLSVKSFSRRAYGVASSVTGVGMVRRSGQKRGPRAQRRQVGEGGDASSWRRGWGGRTSSWPSRGSIDRNHHILHSSDTFYILRIAPILQPSISRNANCFRWVTRAFSRSAPALLLSTKWRWALARDCSSAGAASTRSR